MANLDFSAMAGLHKRVEVTGESCMFLENGGEDPEAYRGGSSDHMDRRQNLPKIQHISEIRKVRGREVQKSQEKNR